MAKVIIGILILGLAVALLSWGNKGQSGLHSRWTTKLLQIPRNIWNSNYRWWWIGIAAFVLFAYGRSGYIKFYTDEGYDIKIAKVFSVPENSHQEIVFEIPDNARYKRIELMESIGVRSAPGERVGFVFPNAKMREYTLPGQKGIDRFMNKLLKPILGMPFQKEEDFEGREYEYKTGKGQAVIYKGSEIEWSKPPYIIIARTQGKKLPFELSILKIRYRVVDQKALGKTVPKK